MRHRLELPDTDSPTPPLYEYQVYDAAHHHVATYSTPEAAASHIAAWPALYYTRVLLTTPVGSPTGV